MALIRYLKTHTILSDVIYIIQDSGDMRTACWHSNGVQFLTSHSNGSLCIWSSNSSHGPIAVKKFYGVLYVSII